MIPFNKWVEKDTVAHPYNEILFNGELVNLKCVSPSEKSQFGQTENSVIPSV